MLERLRAAARDVRRELRVYKLELKDGRTPLLAKILLALAVGYILLPFDIVPDFIPVLGQLDDVVIVPSLVFLALKLVPDDLMEEMIRAKADGA